LLGLKLLDLHGVGSEGAGRSSTFTTNANIARPYSNQWAS
jgi:hypothetical protein